jgi:hypothetical protein
MSEDARSTVSSDLDVEDKRKAAALGTGTRLE